MYIMRNILYLFCIFCLLSSTKTASVNKDIVIDKLPAAKKIESQILKVPPILLRPDGSCIVESFLIIAQRRPDSIFSIFKLPDCKYLLSFGNQGRGPNEFFNSPLGWTLKPVYSNQESFAVQNQLYNIQYYRINDIIKKNITPYKIEKIPTKLGGFRTIGYFSDTIIIGAPEYLDILLLKYYSNNKQIQTFKNYPNKYSVDDLNTLRNIYSGFITVKPDNLKFALAYGSKGVIEIYNINDSVPTTISYKDFPSLEKNLGLKKDSKYPMPHSNNQMIFCWGIKSTNRYIYARIYNDIYSNISDGKGLKRTYIPELTVFDWSGNLVTILKPDYFFTEFNIDNNDNYLYTIDNNIENIIRRYDISKSVPK